MRGKRARSIVAIVAIVVGTIGCGDNAPDDRPPVGAAFDAAAQALANGDLAGACARLSDAAIGHLARWPREAPPQTCPKRLAALADAPPASGGRALTLIDASAAEDRATVRARLGERWPVALPFVWQAGRWKADEITGVSGPPPTDSFEEVVPTPNHFEVTAGDATRRDPVPNGLGTATTADCPAVKIARKPPSVSGGCAVVATFERVLFDVLTLAGPKRLETCGMYFRMVFANDGRAWMSKFGLANITPDGKCAVTLVPCRYSGSGKPYPQQDLIPWHGTIDRTAGRRYRVELAACVDSRVGRFEGDVRFELVPRAGRWVALARHAPVGSSGLRIDGRWRLRSLSRWTTVFGRHGAELLREGRGY